jgi:hypothetical protein
MKPNEHRPDHREISEELLGFYEQYYSKYIALADTKAGVAATVLTVVIGANVTWDPWRVALLDCSAPFHELTVVSSLLLFLSTFLTFMVFAPRRPRAKGLIFWESVARMSEVEFTESMLSADRAALTEERLGHSHALARTCSRKYAMLRWGLWLSVLGVTTTVICRTLLAT